MNEKGGERNSFQTGARFMSLTFQLTRWDT